MSLAVRIGFSLSRKWPDATESWFHIPATARYPAGLLLVSSVALFHFAVQHGWHPPLTQRGPHKRLNVQTNKLVRLKMAGGAASTAPPVLIHCSLPLALLRLRLFGHSGRRCSLARLPCQEDTDPNQKNSAADGQPRQEVLGQGDLCLGAFRLAN